MKESDIEIVVQRALEKYADASQGSSVITDRSSSRKTSKSLFAVAKRNIDNLIDEIYSRFPEHTVNSKRARLVEQKWLPRQCTRPDTRALASTAS